MYYKSDGFSAIETLLMVALLGLIGFVGWSVYGQRDPSIMYSPSKQSLAVSPPITKRVIAVGDIACSPSDKYVDGSDSRYCQQQKTFDLTKQQNADAVLMLGDLQYENGTRDSFRSTFDTSWGTFKDKLYPTPGNHEYLTSQAGGYFEYFSEAPVDVSSGYYRLVLGEWNIYSLNSNCEWIGGCVENTPQLKWLQTELVTNQSTCTLAFWHHPRFTSGKYATDNDVKNRSQDMWRILVKHKADIILNGHDHIYERFARQTDNGKVSDNGVRQFTVGTGGRSLYSLKTIAKNSEKFIDTSFGVLVLDLKATSYDWRFLSIDNKVLDSGSQECSK